jgi:hypothetical protein
MAWANEPSITTLDESSIVTSSSSLQYVNSQLVAHGYIQHPGLSLDGLSNTDTECLVKCLLALLSQRIVSCYRSLARLILANLLDGLATLRSARYGEGRRAKHQNKDNGLRQ